MKWVKFPDPETATEEGIVAVGGEKQLSVALLVSAYAQGIFPWPHESMPLLWFCPWARGILDFSELHISKSLAKFEKKIAKQNLWTYTFDKAFGDVMHCCADVPRPGQNGTWITSELLEAYLKLHRAGFAHSCEVWEGDELVGGIYGVFVKNVFSAESMFFRRSNASKMALWKLITFLQTKGLTWIDVQMVTDVCGHFGARLIPQKDFLLRLQESQAKSPIQW